MRTTGYCASHVAMSQQFCAETCGLCTADLANLTSPYVSATWANLPNVFNGCAVHAYRTLFVRLPPSSQADIGLTMTMHGLDVVGGKFALMWSESAPSAFNAADGGQCTVDTSTRLVSMFNPSATARKLWLVLGGDSSGAVGQFELRWTISPIVTDLGIISSPYSGITGTSLPESFDGCLIYHYRMFSIVLEANSVLGVKQTSAEVQNAQDPDLDGKLALMLAPGDSAPAAYSSTGGGQCTQGTHAASLSNPRATPRTAWVVLGGASARSVGSFTVEWAISMGLDTIQSPFSGFTWKHGSSANSGMSSDVEAPELIPPILPNVFVGCPIHHYRLFFLGVPPGSFLAIEPLDSTFDSKISLVWSENFPTSFNSTNGDQCVVLTVHISAKMLFNSGRVQRNAWLLVDGATCGSGGTNGGTTPVTTGSTMGTTGTANQQTIVCRACTDGTVCQNGGTCQECELFGAYVSECKCTTGFSGHNCETVDKTSGDSSGGTTACVADSSDANVATGTPPLCFDHNWHSYLRG